ncbi:hypothetical protein ACTFIU_003839 [Dictyostelium citrinum]
MSTNINFWNKDYKDKAWRSKWKEDIFDDLETDASENFLCNQVSKVGQYFKEQIVVVIVVAVAVVVLANNVGGVGEGVAVGRFSLPYITTSFKVSMLSSSPNKYQSNNNNNNPSTPMGKQQQQQQNKPDLLKFNLPWVQYLQIHQVMLLLCLAIHLHQVVVQLLLLHLIKNSVDYLVVQKMLNQLKPTHEIHYEILSITIDKGLLEMPIIAQIVDRSDFILNNRLELLVLQYQPSKQQQYSSS